MHGATPLPPACSDIERWSARVTDEPLTGAFTQKQPLMPWTHHCPTTLDEALGALAEVRQSLRNLRPRVGYVHVPFCHALCAFCGFYKNRYTPSVSAPYVDALVAEMSREVDDLRLRARPLDALYFGGGTPSALEPDDLHRLVSATRASLPLAPDCEITMEGRVLHLDDERIEAAIEAGVNRFSLGVQSFDTDVRRQHGRRCRREEVLLLLEGLAAREELTVVIDLIYGLPGQTSQHWEEDLATCLDLGLDGVDLYPLAIFPGTPLARAVREGRSEPPAPLEEVARRYGTGVETLTASGWHWLTNTHFARTVRERNRYNELIKAGAETFAFGAGAGGSWDRISFRNEGCLERYLECVRAGEKPIESVRVADQLQPVRDYILGHMERGYLDTTQLTSWVPGTHDLSPVMEKLLDQWTLAGLLERTGPKLSLSLAGRFWSNNLVRALFDVLGGSDATITKSVPQSAAGLVRLPPRPDRPCRLLPLTE